MKEIATFGAGCFWCTEAVYQQLRGVLSVMPGYAGGTVPHPTYDQVCSGTTGHVEVAQIEFNPEIISFKQLVEVFFVTHNPTTKNRQGNDVGSQYRSVIFYHSDAQKSVAEAVKKELDDQHVFSSAIIVPPQNPMRKLRDGVVPSSSEGRRRRELEDTMSVSSWSFITDIEKALQFYPAEHYHQDYYARNPDAPYCQAIIDPKINSLRRKFAALLKA